jgi:hypothetical protein
VTRATSFLAAAALAAAVVLTACSDGSAAPAATGTEEPAATGSQAGFTLTVPTGWEPAGETDAGEHQWVGPARDDGTRLGLSVSVRCLQIPFADAAGRLQSAEGNWSDYELVGEPEEVDVPGAEQAVLWHSRYTLPDPQNADARARLYSDQLLASADDGTAVLVKFEGRDLWFDPELAATTLDSVTIAPTGC